MNIKQVTLPDGSTAIEIEDGSKPDGNIEQESFFTYEKSEIEDRIIEECERMAEETGKTHFVFDRNLTGLIKKKKAYDDAAKRDVRLDEILEEGAYHIGTENDFEEMPSRFSYYDTETKAKCRYEKIRIAIDFFKSIGFEPSEFNYGPEMEQAFILEFRESEESELEKFVIRLQPNLFAKLFVQVDGLVPIHNGFFSRSKILEEILKRSGSGLKQVIRDVKLKTVLE